MSLKVAAGFQFLSKNTNNCAMDMEPFYLSLVTFLEASITETTPTIHSPMLYFVLSKNKNQSLVLLQHIPLPCKDGESLTFKKQ